MTALFYNFWWLLFPLGGMVFAGFHSWLKYRSQKAILDVIKTYAARGEQPPQALIDGLDKAIARNDDWNSPRSPRTSAHYWSLVGLFGLMAVGFGVGAALGFDGHSGAFVIVAVVMAAVAVWSLINALLLSRQPK